MWVTNRDKERERLYAANEVNGLVQRLRNVQADASRLAAEAGFIAAGMPSGAGEAIVRGCQSAGETLGRAVVTLTTCYDKVRSLDATEWVNDGER